MKNGIIAILFLLVVFLLLYVMGAFNYGSMTDHDYNGAFLSARKEAVSRMPFWKIGVTTDDSNDLARETGRGIEFAQDYLNARGGIQGKPVELDIRREAPNSQETKLLTQEFCERPNIALLIGGLNTEEIPSLRSITQFQGLPLVSSLASLPDSMPLLKPEMTMTYFPFLSLLSEKLVRELAMKQKKRILVVSPGDDSYGGIFATNLERRLHEDKSFAEIYRVNYRNPARFADLYQSLKLFTENRSIDAIVFTDDADCLKVLGDVMRALDLSTEVWGNDYLDLAARDKTVENFPVPVHYITFGNCILADQEFIGAWKKKFGSFPSLWNQMGAQSLLGFAEAVEKEAGYDPSRVIEAMKEQLNRKLARGEFRTETEFRQLPTGK